jgi:transposase
VAKACHIARRTRGEQPPATSGTAITVSTPVLRLTEARWEQISALLPPPKAQGRTAVNSYPLLDGILWIMRTGAPWRHMPAHFGHWHTAYTRYQDWQRSGLWPQILAILQAPDSKQPL